MPEVMFNGSEGRLEGRYHHSKRDAPPIALVLHPHPQHGGTMNNKVVYTLYHAFARAGASVLRFNYRGVGRSQGLFDGGQGELSDAAAALDWLQNVNGNATNCWVAGYSFGAWIGMQLLMRRPEIAGFVSIAPPANLYDFTFLAPCPSSGLIVHGTDDDLVPEASVARLANKLALQRSIAVEYRTIPGADHFFRDHLEVVGKEVASYLARTAAKTAHRAVGG